MDNVTLVSAFVAGVASFVSPCVLPLVPAYISFISGISLEQLRDGRGGASRKRIIVTALLFIAGFSTVFVLLGASATYAGQFLLKNKIWFNRIAGAIIIIFGLHVAGLFQIKFLNYEKRFNMNRKAGGVFSTYLVGLAFAAGWTPCIGPILAAILVVASNQQSSGQGIVLLASYSLGLGIPFFLTAIALDTFFGFFGWVKRHYRQIEYASAALLIILGVMVMTNQFSRLARYFNYEY
ncbi:MAG: cytochrome c biogenesis protein CcdA [Acidimicrobiia bacterium]|nr:cytochrome c biogenesis protein CcdA [Acidimicrobiia bacterium]